MVKSDQPAVRALVSVRLVGAVAGTGGRGLVWLGQRWEYPYSKRRYLGTG